MRALVGSGFLLLLLALAVSANAQSGVLTYPDTLNKKRLRGLVIAESVTYASTMYGLL